MKPIWLRPRWTRPGRFGGKGDGLARIAAKGLLVPRTALFSLDDVQARPRDGAPPEGWTGSVAEILLRCHHTRLIVRSSMSVEDAGGASLAGCFESVVVEAPTPETLWSAVAAVLSSASRAETRERLISEGIDPRPSRAGFLIQEFIPSQLAGVCFSRDPSNPWDPNGAVEWGARGPDVVDGAGKSALARRESPAPAELAPFWAKLWRAARVAETALGAPADLEWVWDGERLWIVQARPIATEEARLVARTRPGGRWTRDVTQERFPEALTPMGWSALEDALIEHLGTLDRRFGIVARRPEDVAVSLFGRVYSDPEFFKFPSGLRVRRLALAKGLGRLAPVLLRRLLPGSKAHSKAVFGLDLADAFLGKHADAIVAEWPSRRDASLESLGELERELDAGVPASASGLLCAMDRMRAIGAEFLEPDLAIFLIKTTTYHALEALWAALGGAEGGLTRLAGRGADNRTLRMNADWLALTAALRADPAGEEFLSRLESAHGAGASTVLGAAAGEAWRGFLARNGHNSTSWDVAVTNWRENPSQLAGLLRASLAGQSKGPRDRETERHAAREEMFERLERAGLRSMRSRVARALDRLDAFMRVDEEQHFYSGRLLETSRRLIRKGERILLDRRVLRSEGSVFFLRLTELKAALGGHSFCLQPFADRRRAEWERALASPAERELPRRETPGLDEACGIGEAPGVVRGLAVSPGTAEGPIHVLEHLGHARGIPRGAILVTTSPNPALTPVYPLLAGMVTSTGGTLSHGFVAAREYGLPAVSGVAEAARRLAPGTRVRVDGNRGVMEVLP